MELVKLQKGKIGKRGCKEKKSFPLLNVLIFIFLMVSNSCQRALKLFKAAGSPHIAKVQLGEAKIVLSPLSKKSLHLKSKVNELGKLGFGSYPFHRLPVPLRKILEHLCDSVSSLPNEKKPSEHAGRDGAAETQGFIPSRCNSCFPLQPNELRARRLPLRDSGSLEPKGLVEKK